MDLAVLHLAVPQLSAQLQPRAAQLLWIADICGFVVAGSLITMGALGDRLGRRRVLLWGGCAFGLASVFAAFSTSAPLLIGARALLGVTAARLAPFALADPKPVSRCAPAPYCGRDPDRQFLGRRRAGSLLGGLSLESFWWGSALLLHAPVMPLLLALGRLLLPELRDPGAGRLDAPSALLSLLGVLAVIGRIKGFARVARWRCARSARVRARARRWAFSSCAGRGSSCSRSSVWR